VSTVSTDDLGHFRWNAELFCSTKIRRDIVRSWHSTSQKLYSRTNIIPLLCWRIIVTIINHCSATAAATIITTTTAINTTAFIFIIIIYYVYRTQSTGLLYWRYTPGLAESPKVNLWDNGSRVFGGPIPLPFLFRGRRLIVAALTRVGVQE